MLGVKLTDLLLAEKNVVDYTDKNLGQERDRLKLHELETDVVCDHLVGGLLDYPPNISHDFCDITTAWDVYIQAFTKEMEGIDLESFGFGVLGKSRANEKNERLNKMPFRGDELSMKQFLNAVVHSCPKLRAHLVSCSELCTESGRLENLYVIISNIVMIRNYLWIFQEVFENDSKSKVKGEYKSFCELVEVISEQMLQCQTNIVSTYILHDEASQNWNSIQPYYEGERGSPVIQMWNYFLLSMQRDMWSIMPPLLSQRILAIILNDSLSILTSRYTSVKPSEVNVSQFVCDIVNILSSVEELLYFLTPDPVTFCGEGDPGKTKIIYAIHLKCECLAATLLLIGTPLEILYKNFRRGVSAVNFVEPVGRDPRNVNKPPWMQLVGTLCSKLGKKDPQSKEVPDAQKILLHLKLLISQPKPHWPLLYKVITMSNCRVASFILNLFPNVLGKSGILLLEGRGFQRCGNAACMSADCHSLPKVLGNESVSACVVHIIGHGCGKEGLLNLYRTIFSRPVDWSPMERSQVWVQRAKPIWFQALIDLLLPILKSPVQALCLSALKKAWNGENPTSTDLVNFLINTVADTLSIIPRGFLLVTEEMEELVPHSCVPVRSNVCVHFFVAALLQLLNLGPNLVSSFPLKDIYEKTGKKDEYKEGLYKETLDPILTAVAERLCHLEDFIFDQSVNRLTSQVGSLIKQRVAGEEPKVEALNDDLLEWDISCEKADRLLVEPEGQLALRVLYWFLKCHGDLVEKFVLGTLESGERKKARKMGRIICEPRCPNAIHEFHYVKKGRTFNEVIWNCDDLDWRGAVRQAKLGLQKPVMRRILEQRHDFDGDSKPTTAKMVEEIKALLV